MPAKLGDNENPLWVSSLSVPKSIQDQSASLPYQERPTSPQFMEQSRPHTLPFTRHWKNMGSSRGEAGCGEKGCCRLERRGLSALREKGFQLGEKRHRSLHSRQSRVTGGTGPATAPAVDSLSSPPWARFLFLNSTSMAFFLTMGFPNLKARKLFLVLFYEVQKYVPQNRQS